MVDAMAGLVTLNGLPIETEATETAFYPQCVECYRAIDRCNCSNERGN